MKSQDIFLLLKLHCLLRLAHSNAPHQPDVFRIWRRDWFGDQALDSIYMPSFDEHLRSNAPPDEAKAPDYGELHFPDSQISPFSVRGLSAVTGIGKSEVASSLKRCFATGLAIPGRELDGRPSLNRDALLKLIIHGVPYVFPAKRGAPSRGVATTLAAPLFDGVLRTPGNSIPVWPLAKGRDFGPVIEPLFKTAPLAAISDPFLYELLALVDAIRIGLPRERALATKLLEDRLKEPSHVS